MQILAYNEMLSDPNVQLPTFNSLKLSSGPVKMWNSASSKMEDVDSTTGLVTDDLISHAFGLDEDISEKTYGGITGTFSFASSCCNVWPSHLLCRRHHCRESS